MATVKENLIAAKALIDTPEKWLQGSWSNTGECFCALGAVRRATGGDWTAPFRDAERALEQELPSGFVAEIRSIDRDIRLVPQYNDTHDHADVMALFDRAIAAQDGAQ